MPNIPGIRYTQTSPGPVDQPVATAAAFGGAQGQGLAQLGGALAELGGYMKDVYDESQAGKASAQAQKELQDFTTKLSVGDMDEDGALIPPPSPDQHEKLYQEKVDSILKNVESSIGSSRAFDMFNKEFGSFAMKQGYEVKKAALNRYKEEILAAGDESLQQDAVTYSNADGLMRPSIKASAFARIEKMERAGIISPVEGLKRRRAWTEEVDMADFMKINRTNPLDAIAAIDNGEFKELPADTQQRLRDRALNTYESNIRTANAESERRIREAEKAERKIQDATEKELWDLQFKGKLTPQEVQDSKERLSTDGFIRLMKASTGGEELPTNRTIYSDLRVRSARGEDVRAEITKAWQAGQIKKEDFDKLMAEVETNSAGPIGENNYKRGREFIVNQVLGADPSLASPSDKAVFARTIDDWSSWVQAHPKATFEQAQKEYTMLANEAKIVNVEDMATTVGVPRYFEGDRLTARTRMSYDSLKRAFNETKAAFERGEIDQYEANRQSRIIESWYKFYPAPEVAGPMPQGVQ